jgi:hypothetical protein
MTETAGFRALIAAPEWARLPASVRRRFGEPGAADVFVGEVAACELSRFARLFDAVSRRLGSPLPACADIGAAVVVSVVDDGAGGQYWTRAFHGRRGFPSVIQSHMRFPASGLEEQLRGGVVMTVDLETSAKGLHFVSRGYALSLGRLRLPLPGWLGPGEMRLDHLAEGEHGFAVVLTLTHPWFGRVLRQSCLFRDTKDQNSSASRSRAMSIAHSP